MAAKANQGPALEDNCGSKAPVGACGHIYLYPVQNFPVKEASLLSNMYPEAEVVSMPLLTGLTVEEGFPITVKAVHKKVDLTSVYVKVTSYHREVLVFHNAKLFDPVVSAPNLPQMCSEARKLFGFSEFSPLVGRVTTPAADLCPSSCPDNYIMGVVVTEGFKERLYLGQLVPLPALTQVVVIGEMDVLKIPLYDSELFARAQTPPQLFYSPGISKYLYEALYTSLAQGLRLKHVDAVIQALEKQFVQDYYKMPKVTAFKEFPTGASKGQDGAVSVIDCAATELAISYGLAYIEGPQDTSQVLSYPSWPIFENCITESDRIAALETYNAKQAIHIHTQLFSANSVLYLTKVQKAPNVKGDSNIYNSYYLQHGLAYLSEPTVKEDDSKAFQGIPASTLNGSNYTPYHLAYAASFSPHTLAKLCYYLQFCQHQRSSANASYNISQYVGSAANSDMCNMCQGQCPATCFQTLFYRIKDRFPQVLASQKRDPYVITGVTNPYNDLDYLGNFASFREKEEDNAQSEETQKYTYWQLNQTLMEKLEGLGIKEEDGGQPLITGVASFLKVFKDIDAAVENELLKFINSMIKNNVSFRENIKTIHHVIQYCCNVYWHPPCPVFLSLFYRSMLALVQDICLPTCMLYEQENPTSGMLPSEWLRMHYQTLYTNFKGSCFDKGAMTGSELKVIHSEIFCDFFDTEAALGGVACPTKVQVRVARAAMQVPRSIKVKNRIVFSNSSATEAIQSGFIKAAPSKDNYIVTGPFMKFLNSYHKVLFPNTKMSSLFFWHTFTQKRKIPVIPGVSTEDLMELVNYVDYNSKIYEEMNVLDVLPQDLVSYAKLKLSNSIMRSCGQTQFYATIVQSLSPKVQMVPAEEYPHVLGCKPLTSTEHYLSLVKDMEATTVQTTLQESTSVLGKTRPIVTLPVVVNKYTGINGNAQIFHCANLGYFVGRGVDKNLIPELTPFKKQSQMSYMRKRHVFMTPMVGCLIKKLVSSTSTFEIENIRKHIQAILEEKGPRVFEDVVLELVKELGPACQNLTPDDLQYYLGQYYIMADEVSSKIELLSETGGDWSVEWAASILGRDNPDPNDLDNLEYIAIDNNPLLPNPGVEDLVHPPSTSLGPSRKRKINSLLNDIDL